MPRYARNGQPSLGRPERRHAEESEAEEVKKRFLTPICLADVEGRPCVCVDSWQGMCASPSVCSDAVGCGSTFVHRKRTVLCVCCECGHKHRVRVTFPVHFRFLGVRCCLSVHLTTVGLEKRRSDWSCAALLQSGRGASSPAAVQPRALRTCNFSVDLFTFALNVLAEPLTVAAGLWWKAFIHKRHVWGPL